MTADDAILMRGSFAQRILGAALCPTVDLLAVHCALLQPAAKGEATIISLYRFDGTLLWSNVFGGGTHDRQPGERLLMAWSGDGSLLIVCMAPVDDKEDRVRGGGGAVALPTRIAAICREDGRIVFEGACPVGGRLIDCIGAGAFGLAPLFSAGATASLDLVMAFMEGGQIVLR